MLSREKPLVKPMALGSISYHISFQSTFICIFTFCIYIIKYQIYIYLIILSLSDLTFASGREGIDNPFIVLVARFFFVHVHSKIFVSSYAPLSPVTKVIILEQLLHVGCTTTLVVDTFMVEFMPRA